MRADREAQLNRIWYEGEKPPWWLNALVPLYKAGNRFDRWYQSRQMPDNLDGAYVIVVGNITVGGSGKTPLVTAVAAHLRDRGLVPAVLSRGYKGRGKGVRIVSAGEGPLLGPMIAGDESSATGREV